MDSIILPASIGFQKANARRMHRRRPPHVGRLSSKNSATDMIMLAVGSHQDDQFFRTGDLFQTEMFGQPSERSVSSRPPIFLLLNPNFSRQSVAESVSLTV
ncbi:hypothetical protein BJX68DRAFT_129360 [Aspergillus pseudodeflectus]|uniref:Uncharacterized protein n=1 Tax=Aspergillus pseudodeflectus TaxID=176178 RepID=A0ABR4K245_9EURO